MLPDLIALGGQGVPEVALALLKRHKDHREVAIRTFIVARARGALGESAELNPYWSELLELLEDAYVAGDGEALYAYVRIICKQSAHWQQKLLCSDLRTPRDAKVLRELGFKLVYLDGGAPPEQPAESKLYEARERCDVVLAIAGLSHLQILAKLEQTLTEA